MASSFVGHYQFIYLQIIIVLISFFGLMLMVENLVLVKLVFNFFLMFAFLVQFIFSHFVCIAEYRGDDVTYLS